MKMIHMYIFIWLLDHYKEILADLKQVGKSTVHPNFYLYTWLIKNLCTRVRRVTPHPIGISIFTATK